MIRIRYRFSSKGDRISIELRSPFLQPTLTLPITPNYTFSTRYRVSNWEYVNAFLL
ncbi:hypothetical protein [Dendronalium sp. ChiSLP03b]|uniref:hypothetical protein n=1 Tax=Dendronalium sp. ChiSLP03b TaxID=3075381 RepID=UPI002AD3EEEA|nr:hypothetical protein [Dendronalium sp. ChiSLP03b]MDZ8206732.1 hypothetical protein [Dendronalium sp. ChiSLP03b]